MVAPQGATAEADPVARARQFAQPLLDGHLLDTGASAWVHAQGVAGILHGLGAAPGLEAAAYLVYAGDFLQRPEEVLRKAFGEDAAELVTLTRQLVQLQRAARQATSAHATRGRGEGAARSPSEVGQQQLEQLRRMLLAFSRDLRVMLLRLASRLQTLRWFAAEQRACPPELARESLHVFAALANRLGMWPIKWEMEDLAFRCLEPEAYHHVAAQVQASRHAREASVQEAERALRACLAQARIAAAVAGRSKHLYSIWKKMQGKQLAFDQVMDVKAVRVIVADEQSCYAALSAVHQGFEAIDGQYSDYIARPKANGYRSLHTVVRDGDGQPLEVQIRTQAMHEHAEQGVAAHWLYKEAGSRGALGVSASGEAAERVAEARRSLLRELLAWERDASAGVASNAMQAAEGASPQPPPRGAAEVGHERIYVFTPQATIIDLPPGATPLDFAYSLHTDLGHRCRGAKVDGALVPLLTPLRSGQTVEVVVTKEGGPSLDWLNPELGHLRSARARGKVRAWFNAQAQVQTVARGRELVERLLQREGRTAIKLDALAEQLGFKSAEALFEVVGKDEFSLRTIEQLLNPPPQADEPTAERLPLRPSRAASGGVLVVGVDSLLTNLGRCCRPAPPDGIVGYVTRGKGVAIHRQACSNLRHMLSVHPERRIEVAWGEPSKARAGKSSQAGAGRATAQAYPVDVVVQAQDRQGLLRDIGELMAREQISITAVRSQTGRDAVAWMTFTLEVPDTQRLAAVVAQVQQVPGVRNAHRR